MRKSQLQHTTLRKRKGFTLIELIVVIAILAILAAIAIPTFLGALNNAKIKADNATEDVIESAARVYRAEYSAVPTSLASLTTNDSYLIASELTWSNNSLITAVTFNANGQIYSTTPVRPTTP